MPRFPNSGKGARSERSSKAILPASTGIDSSQFGTYYVLPAGAGGSDTADGLSPGKAFATLVYGLAAVTADGGGQLRLGPGVALYPSDWRIDISNFRLSGTPGLTTLRPTGAVPPTAYGRVLVHFTDDGTQTTNVHFEDLIFDWQVPQFGYMVIGAVADFTLHRITMLAPTRTDIASFPMQIGGAKLPAQRGRITQLKIIVPVGTQGFAIACTNTDQVEIDGWWLIAPNGQGLGAIDCEANLQTDYLRGVKFKNGYLLGMSGAYLNDGGITQIDRLAGNEYTGNTHINSGGVGCAVPGAKISGNTFVYTPRLGGPESFWGVMLNRGGHYGLSPDNCVIEDNTIIDMTTASTPGISIEACHTRVSGNRVIDRRGNKSTYAVEEVQNFACVLTGLTAGIPSGMVIPLSAGMVQEDYGGAVHNVAAGNVTIPAAASGYDRIDLIWIRPDTQAIAVKPGFHAAFGLPPAPDTAPASDPTWFGFPLYQVYVPANATSILASDIQDVRPFRPNHNEIDQETPVPPLALGTVRLLGSASKLTPRPRPTVTDPYTRSVLADQPTIYVPALDSDGLIAVNYGTHAEDGNYGGGVLLNQQIGVTSRYGAKFDGTGYIQVGRPKSMQDQAVCQAPFTLEAQILPSAANNVNVMNQGFSSNQDFTWFIYTGQPPFLRLGDSGANNQPSSNVSTSALQHWAADWDGTSLRWYLNGTLDGTLTPSFAYVPSYYGRFPVVFGGGPTGGGQMPPAGSFPGFLRHLAIYPTNIGATRIAAHAALM